MVERRRGIGPLVSTAGAWSKITLPGKRTQTVGTSSFRFSGFEVFVHGLVIHRYVGLGEYSSRGEDPGPHIRLTFESGNDSGTMTLESTISVYRSLPSRVRSPTPPNTETPECALAMLLINSMMNTVFPTPAPPNSPILPPRLYGAHPSTTLIPVSKIALDVSNSMKAGAQSG